MHVRRVPKSARTPEEELALCGLSVDDIVARVTSLLQVA